MFNNSLVLNILIKFIFITYIICMKMTGNWQLLITAG